MSELVLPMQIAGVVVAILAVIVSSIFAIEARNKKR